MYIILFWLFVTGFRLYLNKFDYKHINLYMSTIHGTIAPILYNKFLLYENDLLYDYLNIPYNIDEIINVLLFSLMYFFFDIFIVENIMFKLHHIIALVALFGTMFCKSNAMIALEYLFYAEYPIILYNYITYMEIEDINISNPLYYNCLAVLHWFMMIHSRGYHMARIGYNCFIYLEWDLCFYIISTVNLIIYTESIKWIVYRYKELCQN